MLSLSRLNRVRGIDPVDNTMDDRGRRASLKAAQEAAAEPDACFRCRSAAEGSAQIGGKLATNAGGNTTVRYGNARELVLGLEVVLPTGRSGRARRAAKDNTGYDLQQLFLGSEGTLGIITAAVLKLYPKPRETAVALCAVGLARGGARPVQPSAASRSRRRIQAFEYMSGPGVGLVLQHIPGAMLPLAQPAPAYVLVELATPREGADLRGALEAVLGGGDRGGRSSPTR